MKKYIALLLCCLLLPVHATAGKKPATPGKNSGIVVMTQNQYLGADFTPIITATADTYPAEAIKTLFAIAGNNIRERAAALAETIADQEPHLVGLQEMFRFGCIDPIAGPAAGNCVFFDGAFNDHLALTMEALDKLGGNYEVAALVANLNIDEITIGENTFPGLPVYLPIQGSPVVFVSVLDRDVILARNDVIHAPVPFNSQTVCSKPSGDGCNFEYVAGAELLGNQIDFERGFVGVDAEVDGKTYRFVNTHLEVQFPAPNPVAPFFQAAQATQLLATVQAVPAIPGTQVIIVGDINSSAEDGDFPLPPPYTGLEGRPPYLQFTQGINIFGEPAFTPFSDAWLLSKPEGPGYTCCELPDLSNAVSMHDERIDVVFSGTPPHKAKVRVLNARTKDKTLSGLWPSDHATVVAKLRFKDDEDSVDTSDGSSD